MKNIIDNAWLVIPYAVFAALGLLMVVAILTPDKTRGGDYTDAVRYWTDDVYYCENFDTKPLDCLIRMKTK